MGNVKYLVTAKNSKLKIQFYTFFLITFYVYNSNKDIKYKKKTF